MITFEKPWHTEEIPEEWKKANVTPILKKEDPENYKPVGLISMPGKVIEKKNLETICKHLKNNKVIENCQYRFTRGKLCLTNLIAFCNEINEVHLGG